MVMGKILGNKEYPFYDYVVAGVIALGITLFLVRRGRYVAPTLPASFRYRPHRACIQSCVAWVSMDILIAESNEIGRITSSTL